MIRLFIKERLSWILLVLFLHFLLVLVSWLDAPIPLAPILYYVFLSLIVFIIFLAVRYNSETRFYRKLIDWENQLDTNSLVEGNSPFETIVQDSLERQTDWLKQSSSRNLTTLEQEKDDLLSWIHEVKTPLTAMHLMIDRLDDEKLKAGLTYEWLRIHLLLDQQLHQKRLPFMENDLFIEKADLKPLIFKEIKDLQSWCMQKGIGFEVELKAPEALTDAKWLAFIIRQLLTNAVKYSESSDVTINSCRKNGRVVLEIKDLGIGISKKDLPRIFDKGFTSTDHRNLGSAATGMGLYLAKKAAIPLLITIDVSSVPGAGSTFRLTFPEKNEFVKITGM
ncbi:sensor histidine kinase [Mesobacillus zeae]|uniref:histidine kinase n=1 Tax=Mesobacillus zeae TaxID=1917180 RepID=A0A398AYY1_9BACI|nr:sensor histidine kinase [Mesobacillus zeae]RID82254.1 sensor histidine kinase [Mesobacillus zeae]